MTKLASWLIAAGLAMIVADPAQPQQSVQPFRYEVREDMFQGFAGDRAAFTRAMALCEARLAENPNHAEALVWHASGLLFQAGEAFRARNESGATALNQRALTEMARAVALRPDEIEVLVVRASSLLAAAMNTSDGERARPHIVTAVVDFEKAVALQQRQLASMATHPKGELYAGLAEGWGAPRRRAESAILPDTHGRRTARHALCRRGQGAARQPERHVAHHLPRLPHEVSEVSQIPTRHGRACPGHPRLACCNKGVDGRHEAGHDVG